MKSEVKQNSLYFYYFIWLNHFEKIVIENFRVFDDVTTENKELERAALKNLEWVGLVVILKRH